MFTCFSFCRLDLIEFIRNYYTNSIDEARKITQSINETKIPVIVEVDGLIRVQNTLLSAEDKTLLILYYKQPNKVSDLDLCKWIKYKNMSRYRRELLPLLDEKALIDYQNSMCILLPKGIAFVEKNVNTEIIV